MHILFLVPANTISGSITIIAATKTIINKTFSSYTFPIFYVCTYCAVNSAMGIFILYKTIVFSELIHCINYVAVYFLVSGIISLLFLPFEKNLKIIFGYLLSVLNCICIPLYLLWNKNYSIYIYLIGNLILFTIVLIFFYKDKVSLKSRLINKQKGFMLEKAHILLFEILPDGILNIFKFIDEKFIQNIFYFAVKITEKLAALFVIKMYSRNKFKYIRGILFAFVIFIILSIFIALFGSGGLNAGLIGQL